MRRSADCYPVQGPELDIEDKLGDLVDDTDFQAIVRSRSSFNLFEAVGAIRGELRQSNFLGFLPSPARNHGLGAQPLVRVLRAVLAKMPREHRPLTGLELIVGDLDGAMVRLAFAASSTAPGSFVKPTAGMGSVQ